MDKLNVEIMRCLSAEDFRVLTAIEMGMENHELVPAALAASLANLKHDDVHKLLQELCKHRVLSYERGKKFDGYRLTNLGYDYLALNSLTKRNIVESFGNQIGAGKESIIYIAADSKGKELCLKLHRLSSICFRDVTEKRDYHKHRKPPSWLYLSRISATKEFAYMKALYDRKFPVPQPIDFNRHCVIMELVKGTILNRIMKLENAEILYDQLMDLIVRLANSGVVHGDFSEFNIILTDDEKPVIIDFPQMLSTEHPDAEMLFNRDVTCIRKFFWVRFAYVSEFFPKFDDVERVDTLDAEILCSGFTKSMAKNLHLHRYWYDEDDDSSDDEDLIEPEVRTTNETESNSEGANFTPGVNKYESDEDDDSSYEDDDSSYEDVESSDDEDLMEPEVRTTNETESNSEGANFTPEASTTKETLNETSVRWEDQCGGFIFTRTDSTEEIFELMDRCIANISPSSSDLEDLIGIRGVQSMTEEIKKRVKRQHRMKTRKAMRKKCIAKGEASAVTRARSENTDNIKQSNNLSEDLN